MGPRIDNVPGIHHAVGEPDWERLAQARKQRKLTQAEVAKRSELRGPLSLRSRRVNAPVQRRAGQAGVNPRDPGQRHSARARRSRGGGPPVQGRPFARRRGANEHRGADRAGPLYVEWSAFTASIGQRLAGRCRLIPGRTTRPSREHVAGRGDAASFLRMQLGYATACPRDRASARAGGRAPALQDGLAGEDRWPHGVE